MFNAFATWEYRESYLEVSEESQNRVVGGNASGVCCAHAVQGSPLTHTSVYETAPAP
jgi:hypothetical protein